MLVTFSPLIAGLRGKAADAVASSWKGRNYIRKWVIPHNPQTAAQTLVRESFAACVPLWRSLSAFIKTWLDTYGTGYRMSGMNIFIQKCRVLEQAGALIKPVPDDPLQLAPTDLTFVTGVGAGGDIDVTWTDEHEDNYDRMNLLFRKSDGDVFLAAVSRPAVDEAVTKSGLVAGATYDCYGWYGDQDGVYQGTSTGTLIVASKA